MTLFATLLIGFSVTVSAVVLYNYTLDALEEEIATHLKAVVTSTSALFDDDAHQQIFRGEEGEPPDPELIDEIGGRLLQVQQQSQLSAPLHALRRADDFDQSGALERIAWGKALDGEAVITDLYTFGDDVWISAVAPIYDNDREVVGLLQADTSAADIYVRAREVAGRMISVGLVAVLLGAILASLMARTVVRPLEALVEATQILGRGCLDHRIQVEQADEFGDLAEGLNTMAARLQVRTRQLARARDDALAASRSKEAFLANMSHEIRTPMNGIIGMAELLASGPLAAEQREQANTVIRCAESLLAILNDVLDFSKLEAGKVGLNPEAFDPLMVVEDIADLLAPEAWKKSLMLYVSVDPEVPRWVHGDPTRIRQVLTNIISNALKFTDKGHVAIHVSRVDDEWLRFEIEDTGIGIPPEKLGNIFERFEQADQETSRRFGGTGLGLAICRRLVWLMHGEISVSSEEGKGSSFWFELPLPPAPTNKPEEPTFVETPWVLVIHPEPGPRRAVASHCRRLHFEVREADSAEAAERVRREGIETWGAPLAVLLSTELKSVEDGDWPERVVALSNKGPTSGVLALDEGVWLSFPIRFERIRRALGSTRQIGLAEQLTVPDEPTGTPMIDTILALPPMSSQAPRGLRVLVVDDNPVNRRVVTRMLDRMGCDVVEAENGQQAIDLVLSEAPDLVLMDCQMPEMDGFEATRRIRALLKDRRPALPILALTANAMQSDRQRCLEAGMDDHLAKPVRRSQIAKALRQWCLDDDPLPGEGSGAQSMPPAT